ncbi:hypothetical protein TB2_038596 [Malus domestica]
MDVVDGWVQDWVLVGIPILRIDIEEALEVIGSILVVLDVEGMLDAIDAVVVLNDGVKLEERGLNTELQVEVTLERTWSELALTEPGERGRCLVSRENV